MSSRRRAFALVGILFLLTGGRALAADQPTEDTGPQDAGAASDAGSAAPSDAGDPASDQAAPAETVVPAAEETPAGEGGLFEKSQSTALAMTEAANAPFTLTGYMRGDMYAGKVPGAGQADLKAGYGELSLMAKTTKGPYGDGVAEARLRYGVQGDLQQNFVDLREAYVNTYLGPIDLRLGKQIIVWGRADILNPTNNLTPNDLRIRSPIEDDRRIGNVGARMFLRLSPVRLEGVWMPMYVPSELPQVYLPEFVNFGTPVYPSNNLKNGIMAGRLHLELASFEASVSYLHGYAPLPGLTLTGLTFDPTTPSVLVSRTAYKHQVVGIDFSTALGDIAAIRGEAAYRRPYDYQNRIYAPHPDLQYALGADHTFGSVSVIVQYLGRYVFDWEKQAGAATELDPNVLKMTPAEGETYRASYTDTINAQLAKTNQILFTQTARVQHLATLRIEWITAHDTLSLSAVGMVNVTTKEWLASPKIGYRMSDSLTAYLGAEILTGPKDTLFGLVDQTLSAGYAELRSTF